jgi:hypothetical protein
VVVRGEKGMPGRTALLVATTQSEDPGLAPLAAVERDIRELGALLQDPAIGGFDVTLLVDQPIQVTREQIETFFGSSRHDDLLLFYFSGHGIKNDRGALYFATRDTRRERLASTALSADWVRDLLDQSRSRRIVMLLDCSYSGAFMRGSK